MLTTETKGMTMSYETPEALLAHAKSLEGMTFRDVLALGIVAPGVRREYNSRRYKGGMGTLLEERFFGYVANSDRGPDFEEAGVELKATCIDVLRDGTNVAGERLVLTMISYDEVMPASIYESHLWDKCALLLVVWYKRDRRIDPYDQVIEHVRLFTPPPRDMVVIEHDYAVIGNLVRAGRADELSESITTYLGACTKGATRSKSMREQVRYAPGTFARGRAYSYKRAYMNYVLQHYVLGEPEAESIVSDATALMRTSLERYVTDIIGRHVGKTDVELCKTLDIEYTGNKAQWTTIVYRMLGIRGDRAAEFEKAGIRVRTVRPEPGMKALRESFPILNIDFIDLAREDDWEDSRLRAYLEELRYLFVVFEKRSDGTCVLRGSAVWGMPVADLDGDMRRCWKRTRDALRRGVSITRRQMPGGSWRFGNDLPKISDRIVGHVRPRAKKSAYRLEDGFEWGDVDRDAEPLPDGRWMTRQAFWLNSDYVLEQICRHFTTG